MDDALGYLLTALVGVVITAAWRLLDRYLPEPDDADGPCCKCEAGTAPAPADGATRRSPGRGGYRGTRGPPRLARAR